jgi:hypothetical protein
MSTSTSNTNTIPSRNSNSPAQRNSTETKGKQTTPNQSSDNQGGSSLFSSILSLIETGEENDRTLVLHENRAEDVLDYVTAKKDQIQDKPWQSPDTETLFNSDANPKHDVNSGYQGRGK